MQYLEGRLILSPSDLTGFLECEHLTQLELAAARGEIARPDRLDPELEILRRRGLEHEARHLSSLREGGRRVVEVPFPADRIDALQAAHEATVSAMRQGADIIYQGTFFDGRWRCHADFLLRVDGPSALGPYGYQVADAKLARKARAAAVLQCCVYSEQVARVQRVEPEHITLVLGDRSQEELRFRDYAAYYRSVKGHFEATVVARAKTTYPDPVSHCEICRWLESCDGRRRADDHLCLVAGMRRDQTRRLRAAGIATLATLGASRVAQPVAGIGEPALERLRQQARLQALRRETGSLAYEVLPPAGPQLGFEALPPPSPADLFFDMEGDPFAGDDGLYYLFGIGEAVDGAWRYHAFWGHDPQEERRAFEATVDLITDRLDRSPDLHVYHYAPYEPNALKELAGIYTTREAEVDRLLRGRVLVDLYRVVRQGVRMATESYSLKSLEVFYRHERSGEIVDAAASIVAYEDWLERRRPELLEAIARYNEDDCLSTAQLRDWLEARRSEAVALYGDIARPNLIDGAPSEAQREVDERTAGVVERLLSGLPEDEADRTPEQQAAYLLAHSLTWHRREEKSDWWEYFRLCSLTDEQLIEEREAIGGLAFAGEVREERQSNVFRYHFDANQEYKIGVADKPDDPRRQRSAGTVVGLDPVAGWIELSRGTGMEVPHPTSLIPSSPIPTREQREALLRLGRWIAEHGFEGEGPHRALRDLLCLRPPRFLGVESGTPLARPGEPAREAAVRLAPLLDDSYLAIQGPPGSGKTTAGAALVVELVRRGKRVGITASSHKVIGNLLDVVAAQARRSGMPLRALQKADERERCAAAEVRRVGSAVDVEQALDAEDVDVVAGTPWLFARGGMEGRLDALVVDEAGQMALANLLAIAQAASNLVLLGDPNQLRQASRGAHPPGTDRSPLDHVIQDEATMPPAFGLFLETTFRLHPQVCAFVSEAFYDGKLAPDPSCALQSLAGSDGSGGVGIRFEPVSHAGNRTVSPEEIERVGQVFRSLVGLSWTDRRREVRPLGLEDILVVAPYNAQVRRLCENLPEGARVGTVDRFQGQEAPVVIYSMATSSIDDAPRGMDFLFSLNRLNVATSRAQGLVILVCSPELLKARCRTPDQMRLASALCRLVEMSSAERQPAAARSPAN
jgi:uncharacterized protein